MGVPQQMLAGSGGRLNTTITISASTQNYTANTSKVTGYIPGGTDVTFVINSGVVVGSASTGSYAFTVDTSWAAGDKVTVTNAGTVIGRGGDGGAGSGSTLTPGGSPGGPAVSVARTVTWTNTGTCGGGGGGGGGGWTAGDKDNFFGGGGGGGGQGNTGGSGGAGEAIGTHGSSGGSGTTITAGSGGANGNGSTSPPSAGASGGGLGAAGGDSVNGPYNHTGGAGGACLSGKSLVNGGAGITGGTTGGGQS